MSDLHTFFGGTFDPVHYGHLLPLAALAQKIGLKRIKLLPNNLPLHRPQPEANSVQRVAMLRCAIRDLPLFEIDTRELQRDTPSWTVDTLEEVRSECGTDQPLSFIIGQDSLLTLETWHRWQDILSLCHLLICKRPGYDTKMGSPAMQAWLDRRVARNPKQLEHQPAGLIWLAETPLYMISATKIRAQRRQHLPYENWLPAAVIDYIDRAGLYQN